MDDASARLEELYGLWSTQRASEKQQDEFFELLERHGVDESLDALMKKQWATAQDEQSLPIAARYTLAAKILEKYKSAPPIHRVHFLRKWGWAAASILALITAATIFLVVSSDRTANNPNTTLAATSEILPGKDGAILTLADGSQVSLDSIRNGVIALQGGTTAKVVNGGLKYEGLGSEVVYNTMSTPKGRQFHLTLPDGTGVWLNAASSIRYPTVFAGTERKVEITGEAYFEVAKNKKMPFKLNVNNKAEVEVLGTSFNVNAYENEGSINTTLIEGSLAVAVSSDRQQRASDQPEPNLPVGQKTQPGSRNIILKPGQQAQIVNTGESRSEDATEKEQVGQKTKHGIAIVNDADIEKVIAWKKGWLNFEGATLEEVMRQLERWYDIKVSYEKNIPNIRFEGKMARDIPLKGLLVFLERSDVHFRIEGRKLTVLP